MASARTVAVVVPSPATSLVLLAASFTSLAPMFSYLSVSSISSATVTPSLVIVGAPQPLSMTAFLPRGPRVTFTARASLLTPESSALRASTSKANIFAAMPRLLSTWSIVQCQLFGQLTRAHACRAAGGPCHAAPRTKRVPPYPRRSIHRKCRVESELWRSCSSLLERPNCQAGRHMGMALRPVAIVAAAETHVLGSYLE